MSLKFHILIFVLAFPHQFYSQLDVFNISETSINFKLNKVGIYSHFKQFKLFGYAQLILYKSNHFVNKKIVYPKNIDNASEIAIGEISKHSIVNKNIIDTYYFLVLNYKAEVPIIYLSKEGILDFGDNNKIIDNHNKRFSMLIHTQKGEIEYIIDYNQKRNLNISFSEYNDSINVIDLKYGIPIREVYLKYGTEIVEKDTLCLALYDYNHNGLFNEKKIDLLVLLNSKNAPYIESSETGSSSLISDTIKIKINNEYLKTVYIAPAGNLIYLDKASIPIDENYLKLLEDIPKVNFLDADSTSIQLSSKFKKGNYFFISTWINRCTECLKEIPRIDSVSNIYKNKLNTLFLLDKSTFNELKRTMKQLNLTSSIGLCNKKLHEELHINGYPYGLIFDKLGHFIKNIKNATELMVFLETTD